jgi:hypothetical protein
MTRASLLHILDHISEVSDVEVRELEQLATAFPYCQTAHLLLAKAAHDRGSMLASQRLRRAATYATDRQLLRQLIEFTAPTPAQSQVQETLQPTLPAEAPAVAPMAPTAEDLGLAASSDAAASASEASTGSLGTRSSEASPSDPEPVTQPASPEVISASATHSPSATAAAAESVASSVIASSAINTDTAEPESPAVAELTESADAQAQLAPEDLSSTQWATPEPRFDTEPIASSELPTSDTEELLPAVAPPIRPPLETGFPPFEFGLAEPLSATEPAYELFDSEELVETEAATMVPAFYGVADVGYTLGGGSRLGYSLQSTDELTQQLPSEVFFEPDALLLAHLAAHQPTAPTRTSIDIISQFLRNKPRLKTPAALPLLADEQADLSVKSTRAEPDLASESLALIMVRQGKKDRAIEIYERLMVRQPEKMAYFADQIQKLKLSE